MIVKKIGDNMQVAIAKNLENGEILELDDLTFQFVLWLNENKYTHLDSIYARSTLKTTVKEFKNGIKYVSSIGL